MAYSIVKQIMNINRQEEVLAGLKRAEEVLKKERSAFLIPDSEEEEKR